MMQSSFLRSVLLLAGALLFGGAVLFVGGRALLNGGWQTGISSFQLQSTSTTGQPPDTSSTSERSIADSLKNLSPAALGEGVYRRQGCKSCHSLDGSKRVGPSFEGLYGTTGHEMKDGTMRTVDGEYLRKAIVDPDAKIVAGYPNVHPGSYEELHERKLAGLVAFIKAQSKKTPSEE